MEVVRIRFVKPRSAAETGDADGYELNARVGQSLMHEAVASGVVDIVAECGGVLTCGTCHVFVRDPHVALLDPPSSDEEQMLSFTATPRRPNSRLSCQIIVTPQMSGMVVDLPATQY